VAHVTCGRGKHMERSLVPAGEGSRTLDIKRQGAHLGDEPCVYLNQPLHEIALKARVSRDTCTDRLGDNRIKGTVALDASLRGMEFKEGALNLLKRPLVREERKEIRTRDDHQAASLRPGAHVPCCLECSTKHCIAEIFRAGNSAVREIHDQEGIFSRGARVFTNKEFPVFCREFPVNGAGIVSRDVIAECPYPVSFHHGQFLEVFLTVYPESLPPLVPSHGVDMQHGVPERTTAERQGD